MILNLKLHTESSGWITLYSTGICGADLALQLSLEVQPLESEGSQFLCKHGALRLEGLDGRSQCLRPGLAQEVQDELPSDNTRLQLLKNQFRYKEVIDVKVKRTVHCFIIFFNLFYSSLSDAPVNLFLIIFPIFLCECLISYNPMYFKMFRCLDV